MNIINTGIAEISFNEEDAILHVKIIEGAEMDIESTKKHYEEIKKLTGDKKYLALVDAENYFTANNEALEYASRKEVIANRIASAHYNSGLANKFITNFYKVNFKPALDLKIFNTKEEAVFWLKSLSEVV